MQEKITTMDFLCLMAMKAMKTMARSSIRNADTDGMGQFTIWNTIHIQISIFLEN